MASAAPILASMLASKVVGSIGESQGWDPTFTAIASIAAGAGGGALGAGAAAGAGSSIAGSMATSVNPHAGFGIANIAPAMGGISANPHIGMGMRELPAWGRATQNPHLGIFKQAGGTVPTPDGGFSPQIGPYSGGYHGPDPTSNLGGGRNALITQAIPNYWNPPVSDAPTYQAHPDSQERFMTGMKDSWKNTWNDENFITSLGSTFIDGMFRKDPQPSHQGGGGGGGGGPMMPAFSGGGNQQFQMVPMYPQISSPNWQEVA